MNNKALLLLILMLSAACNECDRGGAIYTYGDLKIIRIDRCAKTYFDYSNPNVKKDVGYIWVEYHGFTNSWFEGYLEFDTITSRVTVYGSTFIGENLDTNYFNIGTKITYGNMQQINTAKNSPNWYEITLGGEQWRNDERGMSKVKAQYLSGKDIRSSKFVIRK